MDEIECLPISRRFVAHGVTVQVTARNTGTVIIIARVARGVMDQEEERKYHELTMYSWSSLQRGTLRTEESGRCREVLNKNQYMHFFPPGRKKSGRCWEVAVSAGSTLIQHSLALWTSRCGFRIWGIEFRILFSGTWIRDSNRLRDSEFLEFNSGFLRPGW